MGKDLQNVRVKQGAKIKKKNVCVSKTKCCVTLTVVLGTLPVTNSNCYNLKTINLYSIIVIPKALK